MITSIALFVGLILLAGVIDSYAPMSETFKGLFRFVAIVGLILFALRVFFGIHIP